MLVITVMTHGDEINGVHKLHAKDTIYPANILWETFAPGANPNLASKPRWINIVACRGDKVDPGFTVYERTCTDGASGEVVKSYKLPIGADVLISHSTDSGKRVSIQDI